MKKSWIEMTPDERAAAREFAGMLVGAKNYVYVNDKRDKDSKSLTEDELLIKIMKGLELGFSPMQALDSLYNERGKLTLHAEAMLALAWSSGEMTHFSIEKNDKTGCWIKIGRNGMEPVEVSFTEADAKAGGLLGKAGNWTNRTVLMYRHRCVSKAVRMMFADKTQGLYMTGELSESDFYEEGGEVERIYSEELSKVEAHDEPKSKIMPLPKSGKAQNVVPETPKEAVETSAQEPSEAEIDKALSDHSLYPGQSDEDLKADIKSMIVGAKDFVTSDQFKALLEAEGYPLREWTRENHGIIIDKITTKIIQEKMAVELAKRPTPQTNGNGNGAAKKTPVVDADFELDLYDEEEDEDAGFSSKVKAR